MRNPLVPPSQWELGRITACHPGDDNLTRIVTVKTGRSEYKRPIAKLCFLSVTINSEDIWCYRYRETLIFNCIASRLLDFVLKHFRRYTIPVFCVLWWELFRMLTFEAGGMFRNYRYNLFIFSDQANSRHQAIKTRAYIDPVLITLFVSNGTRSPLRKSRKPSIAHTLRVRIMSSLPDPDQCRSNIAPRS